MAARCYDIKSATFRSSVVYAFTGQNDALHQDVSIKLHSSFDTICLNGYSSILSIFHEAYHTISHKETIILPSCMSVRVRIVYTRSPYVLYEEAFLLNYIV